MTSATEVAKPRGAAVLEAGRAEPVNVTEAIEKVRDALSRNVSLSRSASSKNIYAVLLYSKEERSSESAYLRVASVFLRAYLRTWQTLSQQPHTLLTRQIEESRGSLEERDFGDIHVYWGHGNAQDVKTKVALSEGVYVFPSHLDDSLLLSLGLPALPQPFRDPSVVVQVKWACEPPTASRGLDDWLLWGTRMGDATAQLQAEPNPDKSTLEWRERFVSDHECWTSEEVAKQSGSRARNVSAIASRWTDEKKVFYVRWRGKNLFPKFQFQDGNPIPAVSRVIRTFPEHTTGWELGYFFTTPNSYLRGRKPLELLKRNPAQLDTLVQAYLHPADVF